MEDDKVKYIHQNGVDFVIGPGGVLTRMMHFSQPIDCYIPSVFPTGERITTLGSDFVWGTFDCITIDDDISAIQQAAFQEAHVRKVVWPKSCEKIPPYCFDGSIIEEISNIKNIKSVGSYAFYGTGIQEFTWPVGCKEISHFCFGRSSLKKISNLSGVTHVCQGAFLEDQFTEPVDLSASVAEIDSTAFNGVCSDMILLPWYTSNNVFEPF